MPESRWSAFLLTSVICVLITFLSLEVDAQSTVDDSASTLDEVVNLIREDLKGVKNLLGSNFKDVKNLLGSNQQQSPPTEPSCSNQAIASTFISESRNRYAFDGTC